jgi:hypothetical protein
MVETPAEITTAAAFGRSDGYFATVICVRAVRACWSG